MVVGLNYRVASLGFLYLGEEGVDGNAGLLDQVDLDLLDILGLGDHGGNLDGKARGVQRSQSGGCRPYSNFHHRFFFKFLSLSFEPR